MSDKKLAIKLSTLEGIGNAVREKEGSTDLIPVPELEDRIRAMNIASGENKISQIVEKTLETITPTDLGNITIIGETVFAYNNALKSVALPSTVTTIQGAAFRNCSAMTELTLPASITAIGSQVFQNNVKLATVRFEGTIEDWCNIAFGTYPSVFQEGNTIFYLKNAVGEYEAVTDVVIPNTVEVLSPYVFYSFGTLKSLIIPDSVVEIGMYAFYKCANITSLIIPNGVTTIPAHMCSGCQNLESVTLPSDLVTINSGAFQYCYKLRSLTIPASVSNIESYGLSIGLSSAKATLTFLGTIPPTIASGAFSKSYLEKIIVPKGCGEAYKTATNWANFADYIEEAAE